MLGRSPRAVQSHRESAEQLSAYHNGRPVLDLTADDVRMFLVFVGFHHTDATRLVRFRALRRIHNWAVTEEWLDASPLARLKMPRAEQKLIPIPPQAQIQDEVVRWQVPR